MPESDYRYEVIGNSSMRAVAFIEGKVDAAMLQRPFSDHAIAKGGVQLAKGSDYIPNWPVCSGWGLRKWVEANRSVVVGFTRAMASATDWLLMPENREEMIQIYEEVSGREVRDPHYWEVFGAMRFAAIMIPLSDRMVNAGLAPAELNMSVANGVTDALARLLEIENPYPAAF